MRFLSQKKYAEVIDYTFDAEGTDLSKIDISVIKQDGTSDLRNVARRGSIFHVYASLPVNKSTEIIRIKITENEKTVFRLKQRIPGAEKWTVRTKEDVNVSHMNDIRDFQSDSGTDGGNPEREIDQTEGTEVPAKMHINDINFDFLEINQYADEILE